MNAENDLMYFLDNDPALVDLRHQLNMLRERRAGVAKDADKTYWRWKALDGQAVNAVALHILEPNGKTERQAADLESAAAVADKARRALLTALSHLDGQIAAISETLSHEENAATQRFITALFAEAGQIADLIDADAASAADFQRLMWIMNQLIVQHTTLYAHGIEAYRGDLTDPVRALALVLAARFEELAGFPLLRTLRISTYRPGVTSMRQALGLPGEAHP